MGSVIIEMYKPLSCMDILDTTTKTVLKFLVENNPSFLKYDCEGDMLGELCLKENLSNNSTDFEMAEFLLEKGVIPTYEILQNFTANDNRSVRSPGSVKFVKLFLNYMKHYGTINEQSNNLCYILTDLFTDKKGKQKNVKDIYDNIIRLIINSQETTDILSTCSNKETEEMINSLNNERMVVNRLKLGGERGLAYDIKKYMIGSKRRSKRKQKSRK